MLINNSSKAILVAVSVFLSLTGLVIPGQITSPTTIGGPPLRNIVEGTGTEDHQQDNQKSPHHGGGSIDKTISLSYTKYAKGATGRRLAPLGITRSNR